MSLDERAIRPTRNADWHVEPTCPDYPHIGESRLVRELGPADKLCSWCASHGSGSDELDDRAGAVLRILMRDDQLIAAGIRPQRAMWAFGDAIFVFWRGSEQVTQRAARITLLLFDSEMIAAVIVNTLTLSRGRLPD